MVLVGPVAALTVIMGSPAAAATSSEKCEAAKENAAGVYAKCRFKAEARFAKTGDATRLTNSLTKCGERLGKTFDKADSRYGIECPTTGDVATVEGYLGTTSDQLVEYLSNGAPQPGTGFCDETDTEFDLATGRCVSSVGCGPETSLDSSTGECLPDWIYSASPSPRDGYSLFTDTERWRAQLATMPTLRWGHTVTAVSHRLYAIGGYDGAFLNTVEEYDPDANAWTVRSPMPEPRVFHVAAAVADKIYVIGGQTPSANYSGSVEEYDPTSDTWTTRTPMPTPRYGHAAAAVGGMIYVIGGRANTGAYVATVERYDPATDSWSTMSPMASPRFLHAVATAAARIYAIGGDGSVEEYNPATDSWSNKSSMPTPRARAAAVALNDKIYVIGGSAPSFGLPTVEEFNPASDTWTARPDMPTARRSLGADVVHDKVYAVGGDLDVSGPDVPVGTVEEYDRGGYVFSRDVTP